jgi:Na+/glutamate symporter
VLLSILYAIWGCIPELASDCQDMTNTSSTYFSLLIGAIVGGIVSWWIFKRQKITSEKQDIAIRRIEMLNENHQKLLKRMEQIEQNHQKTLNAIYELNKKMERSAEARDGEPTA